MSGKEGERKEVEVQSRGIERDARLAAGFGAAALGWREAKPGSGLGRVEGHGVHRGCRALEEEGHFRTTPVLRMRCAVLRGRGLASRRVHVCLASIAHVNGREDAGRADEFNRRDPLLALTELCLSGPPCVCLRAAPQNKSKHIQELDLSI